jgi:hypothetical protein
MPKLPCPVNGDDRIPGEDDVEDQGVSKRYRWVFSDSHPVEEAHTERDEPEHRDAHRGAGEQYSPPGRIDGERYRVRHAHPAQQVAAVSRDDEEGIVDPHADHHQLRQLGCHSGHIHDVAQQRNDTQPADQCRDRAGERQRNRTNRPEDDSEDDERGNEAQHFWGYPAAR